MDWTIRDSLQCVGQLHTCDDVHYTDVEPLSVRVVRRTRHEIQWQDVRFTSGSTFEDIRRAEQILVGPSVQVSVPFDKSGDTIDESRTIDFGDTVVFNVQESKLIFLGPSPLRLAQFGFFLPPCSCFGVVACC